MYLMGIDRSSIQIMRIQVQADGTVYDVEFPVRERLIALIADPNPDVAAAAAAALRSTRWSDPVPP